MKREVTIIMTRSPDLFLESVQYGLQWLKERGFATSVSTHSGENIHRIKVSLAGEGTLALFRDDDVDYIFKYHLAENLSEVIIAQWETELIQREILRRFKKRPLEEQVRLLNKARDFLQKDSESEIQLLLRLGRRNRITDKVFAYLYTQGNNTIILEGFINFCLGDYFKEIRLALELASEEIKNEKEYQEFVNLLKYFVDSEPPKKNEVNVMLSPDGSFRIWDQEGREIEEDFIEYYWEDLAADEITLDDLLISILISIAPRRLVVHRRSERLLSDEYLTLLFQVFAGRIVMCTGCDVCSKSLVTHK